MKSLLICVAFQEEYKTIKKMMVDVKILSSHNNKKCSGLLNGFPVELLMTSMGTEAAALAANENINPQEHGGVLVLGYCGGLSLTLKNGDAVIASAVSGPGVDKIMLDSELCEELGRAHICLGLNYRSVPLITKHKVIETSAEKHELFQTTHAEAVDMESSEVVACAFSRDVKVAVIKVVVDDAETELPKFNEHFTKTGHMDSKSVATVMMSQPALSLQLSKCMKGGRQVLEKCVPTAVKVVCSRWGISPLV